LTTAPDRDGDLRRLRATIERQAVACGRLGSPMYEQLLRRIADDVSAAGVFRRLLAGHEHDPGPSALALRVVGGLHWLVIGGEAADLARYYPSVGGTWDLESAWPAVVATVEQHHALLRTRLAHPPQTNEIGRSAGLIGGLLHPAAGGTASSLPIRLYEIGASAGLNLRADRFRFSDDLGRWYGDPDSVVTMPAAWQGRKLDLTARLEVVHRSGCDVAPIDPTRVEGERTLMSYVWPDQAHRLDRLRGAIRLARRMPAEVRREDAQAFVDAITLADGTTTVLWHSVMWQYLAPTVKLAVTERVEALGAQATTDRRFVHLFLEPWRRSVRRRLEFLVVLTGWPGCGRTVLGSAAPHGIPISWE
jgi:hypothetical protein